MIILFLILKALLILLGIFVAVIILIMFLPFKYKMNGHIKDNVYFKANIKLLFGLIRFVVDRDKDNEKISTKINLCGVNIKMPKSVKNKKVNIKEHKFKTLNGNLFTKKVINIFIDYLKEILNIIKPKYIMINGIYGFDDPSITGFVCSFISIINTVLPNNEINLVPVFDEINCDIKFIVKGRIYLFVIAVKTIILLMKKEIRKIMFSKKEKNMKHFKVRKCIK